MSYRRGGVYTPIVGLSTGRRPHESPVLLLDVDGVINCFGNAFLDDETKWWSVTLGSARYGGHVRVREGVKENLARLAKVFEIVWCTAWEDEAHPYFKEVFSLVGPDWRHVTFPGWASVVYPDRSWKLEWVSVWAEEVAGGQPIVWVDDDLHATEHEWAAVRTYSSARTVCLKTDPSYGLTTEITDAALRSWRV